MNLPISSGSRPGGIALRKAFGAQLIRIGRARNTPFRPRPLQPMRSHGLAWTPWIPCGGHHEFHPRPLTATTSVGTSQTPAGEIRGPGRGSGSARRNGAKAIRPAQGRADLQQPQQGGRPPRRDGLRHGPSRQRAGMLAGPGLRFRGRWPPPANCGRWAGPGSPPPWPRSRRSRGWDGHRRGSARGARSSACRRPGAFAQAGGWDRLP